MVQTTSALRQQSVPIEGTSSREGWTGRWSWGFYLLAIAAAELLVSFGSPRLGLGLHLVLLVTLLAHASFGSTERRALLVALVFAPLIRITSLSLPLDGLSAESRWVLASLPLFVGVVTAARVLGLSRRQLGLRFDNLPLQLAIGLVGLPLGLAEYLILRPEPLLDELSWATLALPALILLVCTGFLEELIFRGVLQTTACWVLGRLGLLYVSAIFAALSVGPLSALHVAVACLAGLAFGWLVLRTGSIVGAALAHGLANVMLFLILPVVAR